MAGPLTIQRFPTGLLDLLGMQASGDTPRELAPEVRSTLDVYKFFASGRLEQATSGGVALTAGIPGVYQFSGTNVPTSQIWLVESVVITTTLVAPAATTWRLVPAIYRGSALPTYFFPIGPAGTYAANERPLLGASYTTPLLLLPGDGVGVFVEASTGAANWPNFEGHLSFLRLRI